MYNDSIYRISTHDNLGSLFADKLQKNRVFLLFCLRTYCDSGFAQSSYTCSFFVYYCLSALFSLFHIALFVIGTDYTGSCKSSNHAITTTMTSILIVKLALGTPVPSNNKTDRHHITELV
jgi:hypothetical protein